MIHYIVKVKAKLPLELEVFTESEETLQSDIENILSEKGYSDIEIVEKKLY
jgi:hypothetical protein